MAYRIELLGVTEHPLKIGQGRGEHVECPADFIQRGYIPVRHRKRALRLLPDLELVLKFVCPLHIRGIAWIDESADKNGSVAGADLPWRSRTIAAA
jgi:hypothetical protein